MPFVATAVTAVVAFLGSGTILASIAVSTLLMGASRIITSALTQKPKGMSSIGVNSPTPLQMVVGASRQFCYGTAATGGQIVYWETSGTNNENLWLVVVLHDTPVNDIGNFIVENTVINFTANAATNVFISTGAAPRMWKYEMLGAESQAVEPTLDAASTTWTSNHRLRGVAYYVLKLQHETKVFPTGLPQPIVVLEGRKVWDPRLDSGYGGSGSHTLGTESTYTWSANPAVCLLDYLLGVNMGGNRIGGCGIPIEAIDHESFQVAADICDENVSLAVGGTENRYECHGFVDCLEDKEAVVEAILLAMHGTLALRGGRLYLIAGAAQTSVMALNDDDLAGELTINPTVSRQEKVNKVTGAFADPRQNYTVTPCTPLVVAAYVTDDGGVTLEREIRHRFTSSHTTVDRLNKLVLSSFREQLSIQAVFKPKALEISAGDTFTWSSAAAGYASNKMICLARNLLPDGSVEIVGRQETDSKYSWATSEELAPPEFDTGPFVGVPPVPATITGLVIYQLGGTVTMTWDEVTTAAHLAGYDLYYGAVGGNIGTATLLSQGSRLTKYTTNNIVPGRWVFYCRARDTYGQVGTAQTVTFTVITSSDSSPAPLTTMMDLAFGNVSDVIFCLDFGISSCVSSPTVQTVLDLTANSNNFVLGPTTGASAADPTFKGTPGKGSANEYYVSDGGDFFSYVTGTRPAAIEAYHKNNAQLTIAAVVAPINGVGREFILLTDYDAGDDTGFRFWIDEENYELRFKVLNNGATVLDVSAPLEFHELDGRWGFFGVTLNEGTANGAFFMNGREHLFTSTYSSPSAASAEGTLYIGALNDGPIPSTDRISAIFAMDNNLTAADFAQIYEMFRDNRPGFALP